MKQTENFDSCNSCKRLGTSRLHELHESKFPLVSRIEFIRSKLSNFSVHVYGVNDEALVSAHGHHDMRYLLCQISFSHLLFKEKVHYLKRHMFARKFAAPDLCERGSKVAVRCHKCEAVK